MKNLKSIIVSVALIIMSACSTNMDNILSSEDILALEAMETSYLKAAEANSTLAQYIESTGINDDATCFSLDSIFHESDSMFEASHMRYSHRNRGDNHNNANWSMGNGWMSSTGGMMGNSGNTMGSMFSTDYCNPNDLDLMDSLMMTHEEYHPEN